MAVCSDCLLEINGGHAHIFLCVQCDHTLSCCVSRLPSGSVAGPHPEVGRGADSRGKDTGRETGPGVPLHVPWRGRLVCVCPRLRIHA